VSEENPAPSEYVDPSNQPPVVRVRRQRSRTRVVGEWLIIVIAAVAFSFLIRTYAFQTFYIPSASMEPTLQLGDRLIVDKLSVDFGTINRGDIVVF